MKTILYFIDSLNTEYEIIFNEPKITIIPKGNEIGYRFRLGHTYTMGNDFQQSLKFLLDCDVANFNNDVRCFLIKVMRNMIFV